jgi:hypothetical protein
VGARVGRRLAVIIFAIAVLETGCSGSLSPLATPSPSPSPSQTSWCPAPNTIQQAGLLISPSNPSPRPAFVNAMGNPPHVIQLVPWAFTHGTWLLHTFNLSAYPSIVGLHVVIAARPLYGSSTSSDDEYKFYSGSPPIQLYHAQFNVINWSTSTITYWTSTNFPGYTNISIPAIPQVYPSAPPGYPFSGSILTTISSSGLLDVAVGDDTDVNFVQVEVCLPPAATPTPAPSPVPTASHFVPNPPSLVAVSLPPASSAPGFTFFPIPSLQTFSLPHGTPSPTLTPQPSPTPAPTHTPTPTPTPTAPPSPTPTATASPAASCDLALTKRFDPTGQPGVYVMAITVTNIGSGSCPAGAAVSDALPNGMQLVAGSFSYTETGGSAGWSCSGLSCVAANSLPSGYSVTFTFQVTAQQSGLTNCAAVKVGADVNLNNNRDCVTVS